VIGGLILAFISWTGLFPAVWNSLTIAAKWSYHIFLSSVPIPVWIIALVSPLIIATLLRIFATIRRNNVKRLTWRDYKEDDIMGMKWRWNYGYYSGDIHDISCFCPSDDTQLIYKNWGSKVVFHCETCDRRFGPFEGHLNYFFGRIQRQIHRKIRSGEWKAIVAKMNNEGCH
jgi:hypothetical protein